MGTLAPWIQLIGAELDQNMSRLFTDVVCIPNKAGFGLAVTTCRSVPGVLSGNGLGSR